MPLECKNYVGNSPGKFGVFPVGETAYTDGLLMCVGTLIKGKKNYALAHCNYQAAEWSTNVSNNDFHEENCVLSAVKSLIEKGEKGSDMRATLFSIPCANTPQLTQRKIAKLTCDNVTEILKDHGIKTDLIISENYISQYEKQDSKGQILYINRDCEGIRDYKENIEQLISQKTQRDSKTVDFLSKMKKPLNKILSKTSSTPKTHPPTKKPTLKDSQKKIKKPLKLF